MRRAIPLLLTLVLLLLPAAASALEKSRVVVETAGGVRHSFQVEVAVTLAEQSRGLMWVEKMAPEAGMLFLYDQPQRLSFWMKNTLIPLDLIFIAADGRILNIEPGRPHDLTPILSRGDGVAVLEINGGLSATLGIRPGDRVLHPHFGTPAP